MSASITQNAENSRQTEQMATKGRQDAEEGGRAVGETVEAMTVDRREDLHHRGDRLPDQPAGPERRHRGGAGRRARQGLRGGGHRGAQAGRAHPEGGRRDQQPGQLERQGGRALGPAASASWCPPSARPADLVQEVAAASQEQSSGVAQINKAMAQVDQVTQRNASAAEELSSTAEELTSQAESLQQLMAFFQVKDGHGGAAVHRPAPALPAATPAAHDAPPAAGTGPPGPGQRLRGHRPRLQALLAGGSSWAPPIPRRSVSTSPSSWPAPSTASASCR